MPCRLLAWLPAPDCSGEFVTGAGTTGAGAGVGLDSSFRQDKIVNVAMTIKIIFLIGLILSCGKTTTL